MSSLKSFFRKKHRFETQADLKDMTAEQIVNLNPKDVGTYLENETGGIPLEGQKRRAMFALLAIKKREKEAPNATAKQRAITSFLQSEGIQSNPEVDKLIVDTHTDMIRDEVFRKNIQNRLDKLNNLPPSQKYTDEEMMIKRLDDIKGGKRRRTVSKGKRRGKTRKGRKGRKTNRRR
jgi:hypothetical protein